MIHALIVGLFLLFATTGTAQKIDKDVLTQTWCIEKYSDAKKYYRIPRKEQGDHWTLQTDGTFSGQSDGKATKGTWMLNRNGTYFELRYSGGTREKAYISYLSSKTLVVLYDTDAYREFEAHYVSCTP